jgi:phasin family protein
MADETVVTVPEAAEKVVEQAVAEAPAIQAPIEPKPATPEAKPKAPQSKQPPKKPATSKRLKAAKPASKPVAVKAEPARKPTRAKARPAREPAITRIKPVRAGAMREGVETMTKQTNDAGLFAAEQFRTVFGDVNERAKATMERNARIVEELSDLTRGNVEALVASSKVAAKGVEALSQDVAEYSRKSFEEASTVLKSLAEVKSATDLFKLQGDYARAAFDAAIAESARVSEAVLKIAGDVAEPITSRYTVAAERVKTLAA